MNDEESVAVVTAGRGGAVTVNDGNPPAFETGETKPAWYCLMVRKGSEANVAGRVIKALGLADADVVLSKVNQWYLLVRMEPTIENLASVAQIRDAMFFVGSPNPPEVPEKDVDVVREGREGQGADSFLARHFGEWLWHRLKEDDDRESGLLFRAGKSRWLKRRPRKNEFWRRFDLSMLFARSTFVLSCVLSLVWAVFVAPGYRRAFENFHLGGDVSAFTRMAWSTWWPFLLASVSAGLFGLTFTRRRPQSREVLAPVALVILSFVLATMVSGLFLPIVACPQGTLK
ncbi:MAG: hypothetical protein HY897_04020 [Deltaproteobacteria bacterium]|nr:hypothetical protein [Deltaproteobacteria bacterium]